jgi:peptidoglycan/LPS O-acetylase OafA/YrhL
MGHPSSGDQRQSPYDYRHFGAFRLLLASLVLLQHYIANIAPLSLSEWMQANEIGSVAVLVFFCLSGFVISEAADRLYLNRPAAFITNRMLRIVPHFLVAVFMSIAIHYAFSRSGTLRIARVDVGFTQAAFAPQNILLNLISFLPLAHREIGYNFLDIAWAIRVEMAFYLIIAACLALVLITVRPRLRFGFGMAAFLALLILAPLFPLALLGRAAPMLQFLPHFTYGCALYFWAAKRKRVALAISAGALVAMAWQFLSQSARHPEFGFERAVATEFVELTMLVGLMTALAFKRFQSLRDADRFFGDLTYPLYLYHQNIMIVVLSLTAGYSYAVFAATIVAAFVAVYGLHRVIDPLVDRERDRVRGRQLGNLSPPSSSAPSSLPTMAPVSK